MARNTKLEAQATRSHILDTAELVFERGGVSGTSLQEVAKAAGLTRGAIYWHFKDKADLFIAMMDRVTLPLEETDDVCGFKQAELSVAQMRNGFVRLLKRLVADPQMRRVFEIATHKVEYVDGMRSVRDRHLNTRNGCLVDIERTLQQAVRRGELSRRMSARVAAIGLHALLDGLIHNWMLEPTAFNLVKVGAETIDAYLASMAMDASSTVRCGRVGAKRPTRTAT